MLAAEPSSVAVLSSDMGKGSGLGYFDVMMGIVSGRGSCDWDEVGSIEVSRGESASCPATERASMRLRVTMVTVLVGCCSSRCCCCCLDLWECPIDYTHRRVDSDEPIDRVTDRTWCAVTGLTLESHAGSRSSRVLSLERERVGAVSRGA